MDRFVYNTNRESLRSERKEVFIYPKINLSLISGATLCRAASCYVESSSSCVYSCVQVHPTNHYPPVCLSQVCTVVALPQALDP